eukprot:TRINITY_DN10064_c0_g1_i2.p1 TRINITY_DN10064_c0_g1~~TRINITY_DN10064_c0_g1_i2.p1  ORF type:complete len:411 (-),score=70.69 TRINITY_DN10064_c0_g1_i2:25-1257(-)
MVQTAIALHWVVLLASHVVMTWSKPMSQATRNMQQAYIDDFIKAGGLSSEQFIAQSGHAATAAEKLEQHLIQDGWTPIKRIQLKTDAAGRNEQRAEIIESMRWNIPLVLENAEPWPSDSQNYHLEQHVEIINRTLQTWLAEDRDRFDGYWIGGHLGRHVGEIGHFIGDWSWPLSDLIRIEWYQKMYGSYAAPGFIQRYLESEFPNNHPPFYHIDNVCQYAFALQMSGTKLYTTQGPDLTKGKNEAHFHKTINDFYQKSKLRSFEAQPGFESRFAILKPGDILLYTYWMPHHAGAIGGHAWSYNGDFDFVSSEDDPMKNACPGHLQKLCQLDKEVGYGMGPYPVQPWDEEWEPQAAELREARKKRMGDSAIKAKWKAKWRQRTCAQPGGQPVDDKNAGRDAECHELKAAEL